MLELYIMLQIKRNCMEFIYTRNKPTASPKYDATFFKFSSHGNILEKKRFLTSKHSRDYRIKEKKISLVKFFLFKNEEKNTRG